MVRGVFITGGSKGIGAATAKVFSRNGWRVAFSFNSDKKGADEVAKDCRNLGAKEVLIIKMNVLNNASIVRSVDNVVKKFGGIDVLINNSGVINFEEVTEQSFKEIENQLRVNLEGLMKVTSYTLPHMNRGGIVINIASRAGKRPHPTLSVYCASKFGVRGFTQTVAKEYDKIKFFAINPDVTSTQMTDFEGMSPDKVAKVIYNTACLKCDVKSGGDVDVWKHL